MTHDDNDRREELIAAALAGDLTSDERELLARLRADDPSIDIELAESEALLGRLDTVGAWDASEPDHALGERIRHATADGGPHVARQRLRPRRRTGMLVGTAAACLALGAFGGLAIQAAVTAPPGGPAGTLGALEQVDFSGEPSGASVAGSVIAHTWGTEASLRLDGLASGAEYSVVLLGRDGREFDAGTILGTPNTVTCRMNAAVLREDVTAVEIRDAESDAFASAALVAIQ